MNDGDRMKNGCGIISINQDTTVHNLQPVVAEQDEKRHMTL